MKFLVSFILVSAVVFFGLVGWITYPKFKTHYAEKKMAAITVALDQCLTVRRQKLRAAGQLPDQVPEASDGAGSSYDEIIPCMQQAKFAYEPKASPVCQRVKHSQTSPYCYK